ncbi:type VII secretion protein EccE [Micromonospora sp. WMMA1363]|uniref:type VII secretion protein EccE n=1 Tax=Micromonospora sp. WMMA1363 TaxID=3053985 RepID=UPI00259C9F8E|nr:type VII secretion protein EccE [Micromonospora sp. WMMA1363]MDM4722103.1 type VII secretion protein EccE [Micromonospora sp. WMMA1363]
MPPQWNPSHRRFGPGLLAGQVVAGQVAVAVVVAALGRGAVATVATTTVAVLVLALAGSRWRKRWLFEWLGVALAYASRRRALAADATPADLLELADPGAVVRPAELVGASAAVLDDATGLVALLEIVDPVELISDGSRTVPPPAALLSAAPADGPPVRIQLLLTGAPAPAVALGGGTVATSYRQLTDGRLPGRERAVLAVRVLRVDGVGQEELRRALHSTLRRIIRQLGPVSARPMGEHAALRILAELAHHDGGPVRETWPALRFGDRWQATFHLDRWPDPRTDGNQRLVSRLRALPATAITVSLSAGPWTAGPGPAPSELTVRVAAGTPAELSAAERALHRTVTALGGGARRLDGEQFAGLVATVPLALPGCGPPGRAAPELSVGDAGLMVGANRHGGALTVRLFRPESTRVVLVGGLRAGQLFALRALALGARVVVQTARPRAWEPFGRGVGTPGTTIPLLPPGRPPGGEPGSPLRPLLLVVDTGPLPPGPEPGPPWQATLLIRDELTAADVATLGRADLAVLQPLDPAEAALAGRALGLGASAEWLTRIRQDMVAVVNRRALRWARLAPSPIEAQLVGQPARR